MPRYKLTLEYDGGPFVGWQRQENGHSVQAAMENAVAALTGAPSLVYGAGRTDAGVHALAMVAHVDIEKDYGANVIQNALNQHLRPAPIAVLDVQAVSEEFHARFSCMRRAYEYRIINRRAPLTLERGRAWRISAPLDAEAMHNAAQALVGLHDFSTFRSMQCQAKDPVKTLDEITVSRAGEDVILRCAARSFLHHQVRSITGSLVEVGRGKWRAREVKNALEAKSRAACGPVAPPDGLYFRRADYETS